MKSVCAAFRVVVLLTVFSGGVAACGSTTNGPAAPPEDAGTDGRDVDAATDSGASAGGMCQSDADCSAGLGCGFLMTDACAATGSCQPFVVGACNSAPICACDGTVTLGCSFANGYSEGPVFYPLRFASNGACSGDGGID
jgi:hypothetical protein